jgi:hypothetical protein
MNTSRLPVAGNHRITSGKAEARFALLTPSRLWRNAQTLTASPEGGSERQTRYPYAPPGGTDCDDTDDT